MVKTVYIEAEWEDEIKLGKEVLNHLKENNVKTVALFASVQFLKVDTVKKQLEALGISIKTTKAKRTHVEMQILGCDAYSDSFEEDIISSTDAILYIGDGRFHPLALLHAQRFSKEIKPVLIWDPVGNIMKTITSKDIEMQNKKTQANLRKFISAEVIGILVTVKPGQQYIENGFLLKKKLEEKGKKCYIFVDNTLNIYQLENYNFIDAWVNTACPRIGFDDILNIEMPLINIREAYDPVKALEDLER